MPSEKPAGPTIALLALPQSTPAAIYGLYEVFLSAGRTWEQLTGERSDIAVLSPRIVGSDGRPVGTACGLSNIRRRCVDDATGRRASPLGYSEHPGRTARGKKAASPVMAE